MRRNANVQKAQESSKEKGANGKSMGACSSQAPAEEGGKGSSSAGQESHVQYEVHPEDCFDVGRYCDKKSLLFELFQLIDIDGDGDAAVRSTRGSLLGLRQGPWTGSRKSNVCPLVELSLWSEWWLRTGFLIYMKESDRSIYVQRMAAYGSSSSTLDTLREEEARLAKARDYAGAAKVMELIEAELQGLDAGLGGTRLTIGVEF